jgi:hypothetical protein
VDEKKPPEWTRSEKTDQMDGHKTVTLSLQSSNTIHFPEADGGIRLQVVCDKRLKVQVESGAVTSPIIRYKLDSAAPQTDRWYDTGYVIFTSVPEDLLRQLMRAKTFHFEFVPVGSYKQIATWNLGNLAEVVQREQACNVRNHRGL